MTMAVEQLRKFDRFPVDLDLTDEFLKTFDTAPKETPENRAEKIQELLRLINDTPELIVSRTDDAYLLRFLRAKYFHTNYAFQLLKNYEEFKQKNSDTWLKVNLPILKKLTCSGAVQVLPTRDQHGRRIFYLQGAYWKPSDCIVDCVLQTGGLCGDATIVEPKTQVAGIIMIFNLKDVGMTQFKGISAAFAKKMVYFLANCLPVRINAIHVINEPSIFSMIFALFKAFLTERMRKRIHFHGSNFSSLHSHVTPSCLPAELGGTYGPVDPQDWYEVLTSDVVLNEFKSMGYKFEE